MQFKVTYVGENGFAVPLGSDPLVVGLKGQDTPSPGQVGDTGRPAPLLAGLNAALGAFSPALGPGLDHTGLSEQILIACYFYCVMDFLEAKGNEPRTQVTDHISNKS